MGVQLWEVVGGADKGGILVREGEGTSSAKVEERLATGSIVEEVKLAGERLNYKIKTGSGPQTGWVSIKITGKDLLVRVPETAAPAEIEAPDVSDRKPSRPYSEFIEEYQKRLEDTSSWMWENWLAICQQPLPEVPGHREDPSFEARKVEALKNLEMQKAGADMKPLPPYKKFRMDEVKKLAIKTIPGEMYGLPVPPTLADLQKAGVKWLNDALHKAGTLPSDNSITKLLEFKRLPMTGKDAKGGSGPKAFLKVKYAKEDPELHTDLFVKMPWSVSGESKEMGGDDLWRWKISCFQDNDGQEVTVYRMLGPIFPFKIPKYYFADICRENTNYILITEKLQFGKKVGQSWAMSESKDFAPYEALPLAEKYWDFQLEPRIRYEMYYSIMRAQARMAAWDKMGYFNHIPAETRGYHMRPGNWTDVQWPPKMESKKRQRLTNQAKRLGDLWMELLKDKGKKAYAKFQNPKFLEALEAAALAVVPYQNDINQYFMLFPEMIGMMHSNLQSDNAYYWWNDNDQMDCGIIDWGGLSPGCLSHRLTGSITSATGEVLDEHEDGLLQCWIDEYYKECGIKVDFDEMKRHWNLGYMNYLYSMGMNIEQEVFRECPREEWATLTDLFDERTAGMWNCRCYVFMIYNALTYLMRRWKRNGEKRLHIHDTFIEWKAYWESKGMQ